MAQTCTHCGGTSFHYNRSRMRMECSTCGTPVNDAVHQEQLMQYDRTYTQAMGHLLAGNWDQTISLLRPLLNQYPTDKKLYIATLRAATQDFQDLTMNNTGRRTIASDSWDKLIRLNGITPDMIRYGRRRYEMHINELIHQRNSILIWLFTASAAILFMGIAMDHYTSFLVFVFIACMIGCFYKLLKKQPMSIIKQLSKKHPDYRDNPFI